MLALAIFIKLKIKEPFKNMQKELSLCKKKKIPLQPDGVNL